MTSSRFVRILFIWFWRWVKHSFITEVFRQILEFWKNIHFWNKTLYYVCLNPGFFHLFFDFASNWISQILEFRIKTLQFWVKMLELRIKILCLRKHLREALCFPLNFFKNCQIFLVKRFNLLEFSRNLMRLEKILSSDHLEFSENWRKKCLV